MKNVISKGLLSLGIALVLAMTSNVAEAGRCVWVSGHWSNGFWQAGHRVCYGYGYRDRVYYRENVRRCWWRNGRRFCN